MRAHYRPENNKTWWNYCKFIAKSQERKNFENRWHSVKLSARVQNIEVSF